MENWGVDIGEWQITCPAGPNLILPTKKSKNIKIMFPSLKMGKYEKYIKPIVRGY